MREFIDNIKDKLGFKSYPKLAELLGITKDTIMKLNQGAGGRKLQIAYTLFSLCLDEMSELQRRKLLDEYHALLYRSMYAEDQKQNDFRRYIEKLMEICGYADYTELAKFFDMTEELIIKLNGGKGSRRLRIIYTLLGLAFSDVLSIRKVRTVLRKYHSLLYRRSAV